MWFGLQSGGIAKWNMNAANNDIHKGYEIIKQKGLYYIQKMYTGKRWLNLGGLSWMMVYIDMIAVTNKLLAHYTKTMITYFGTNSVNDVYQYNDSILLIADGRWICLILKTNKITHISTENRLAFKHSVECCKQITKVFYGWALSNQLCRFDLQRKIFSTFDRRDGISYDLFNIDGDYKMKDGRLVYLTDKNFISFNPASATISSNPAV